LSGAAARSLASAARLKLLPSSQAMRRGPRAGSGAGWGGAAGVGVAGSGVGVPGSDVGAAAESPTAEPVSPASSVATSLPKSLAAVSFAGAGAAFDELAGDDSAADSAGGGL